MFSTIPSSQMILVRLGEFQGRHLEREQQVYYLVLPYIPLQSSKGSNCGRKIGKLVDQGRGGGQHTADGPLTGSDNPFGAEQQTILERDTVTRFGYHDQESDLTDHPPSRFSYALGLVH